MSVRECPFCEVPPERVFYEGLLTLGIWDGFPVSSGHALVITKRHVASWFEASPDERIEIVSAIDEVRTLITRSHRPTGFNIGINVGKVAGQTVFHVHAHVIPRYAGDVPDPRGGVRHVIPAKANYIGRAQISKRRGDVDRAIVTGGEDPLLQHLRSNFKGAEGLDIGVAFTLPSGVRLLKNDLRDLLMRNGNLRFLTGDYLDVTDPDALRSLQDLEGNVVRRVFQTGRGPSSFHPKTYIFHYKYAFGIAFVGSSNLSETALHGGIEWDYKVVSSRDPAGFADVRDAFDGLFTHPATCELTYDWIKAYEARRRKPRSVAVDYVEVAVEAPPTAATPHDTQKEALAALEATRRVGNTAGLVVLATGLGKTWLAAFDSCRTEFKRILFVAHRQEILQQAMDTFRQIRPGVSLGNYDRSNKDVGTDVLFASIQTIGKTNHLERFATTAFDYMIVDEFHHGHAPSYRRLIEYFGPKFMLGLTATPERTDGGDLLALCEENLVYRCDLGEGIRRKQLCPFHYFGVPDEVDYRNIPWKGNRFDEEELTTAVATISRANNALDQYKRRAGTRTLAFCVSQRHADFMANHFRDAGFRTAAVHSGDSSDPRTASLESLAVGELDIIFAVDMFNEGVDLPSLDTVMMLRPTESKIVWLQQLGRGLRTAEGKSHLTVIDYIGNHRTFLLKPMTLLEALTPHLTPTNREIWNAVERLQSGSIELPPGCEVTYDLESIQILQGLLKLTTKPDQATREYYNDFKERMGQRPTAVEAYHDGFSPKFVRKVSRSWLRFVQEMGDLTPGQESVLESHDSFFSELEITKMTRSYKILLLKVLLKEDRIPGQIDIEDLTKETGTLVATSSRLRADLSVQPDDLRAIYTLLKRDPIAAWTGLKDRNGKPYFEFFGNTLRTTFSVPDAQRESFRELTREIADWRLAEYLGPETEDSSEVEPMLEGLASASPKQPTAPEMWKPYQRREVAACFGLKFSTGNWNAGMVRSGKDIFLLITLAKETKAANFKYQDRFLDANTFQMQSQNQTAQSSKTGQAIRNHGTMGIAIHLFVRRDSKTPSGTAAPFHYCGDVDFVTWQGEKPITITWRLKEPLPNRLQEAFRVPSEMRYSPKFGQGPKVDFDCLMRQTWENTEGSSARS